MDERATPFGDPAGGKDEIFGATYRVLHTDGYAALSIQRIADEASLSKSTIYHHFESKDDLLLEFSQYLLTTYIDGLLATADADVLASIDAILDLFFPYERGDGASEHPLPDAVHRVYLEMRTQAAHDETYRAHFDAVDHMVRERVAGVIREGIDQGVFRPVDPDAVAGMLYVFLEGTLFLSSTTDDHQWLPAVREELERYLAGLVYAEDGAQTEPPE
ncbi:TetR/AcrR family transcriptional regulator [Natronobiforma cellulositropha]|uniref:TetR/AcrR family transcriptional regulator n=1 Tax=Natronobiforma cellulositropha TaxID=1679076 RepID=UPI0021D5D10A|nr:TetR/AcrR family transcriptional regulator [Natronobiforma cellulositropha]